VIAAPAESAWLRLCFWEEERAPLTQVIAPLATPPAAAIVIVGPEGGLGREEVDAARAAGWRVAGFGPRVLRTETAGPAIVAALQFEFGDLA
jgi:16S rRNA (uracil1498-N3)-methyltransferase